MPIPPITERDEALIADYLADALAPPQRAEVEQRLATESAFAAEYRAQERLIALLRALPARPAPRSFALTPEQAQPGVRVLPAPARPLRPAWLGIASAAAVALLLGGGVLLLLSNQPPEPAAQVAAVPTQATSPAPTLTEADAAIMQLQSDLQAQATPTQALLAPPPRRPDSAVPQAAMLAPAASPPPDSARQVGGAPTDDAEGMEVFSIMSAPAEGGVPAAEVEMGVMNMSAPGVQAETALKAVPASLADALPRLIASLLRLLFALFNPASSP